MLKREEIKLSEKIGDRKDDTPRAGSINQQMIGAGLLGLGASILLASAFPPRKELQDHPQCGIATDGKVSDAITRTRTIAKLLGCVHLLRNHIKGGGESTKMIMY